MVTRRKVVVVVRPGSGEGGARQRKGVGWFEPGEEVPAFSHKIASILDASWPETKRYTAKPVLEDVELDLRPKEELFDGAWERDLLSALDDLDAAEVTPEERKRLSRDPGAAEIRAQLARGPKIGRASCRERV